MIAHPTLDGVVHALVRVRTRLCECALTFLNLSRGCLRGEDLLQFASTAKVLLARGDARTESREADVVRQTDFFEGTETKLQAINRNDIIKPRS